MTKIVKIYEDGKQFVIDGSVNMELNNHGKAEAYEVDVSEAEFENMMEKPDKIKIKKILKKRKIK